MLTDDQLEKLEYMSKIKIPQEKRQKMKESVESFVSLIKVLDEWKNKKGLV